MVTDGLNLTAERDGFQFRTLVEGFIADSCDIVGLAVVADSGGNSDIAVVAETAVASGHGHRDSSRVNAVIDTSSHEVVGLGRESSNEQACCQKC